jgi:O-6-methylguanine DNA methyltransferase
MDSGFRRRVLIAAKKIPRGRVISYKALASLAGYKNASRAAGGALASNPSLIKIPCHRVVCSDGRLGGYKKGKAFKKRLLEKEGIVLDRKGRVLKKFFLRRR